MYLSKPLRILMQDNKISLSVALFKLFEFKFFKYFSFKRSKTVFPS